MGLSARGGGHFQVCSGVVFVLRQLARGFVFLVLAAASAGAADFVEFRFREPQPVAYRVELPAGARVTAMLQPELAARRSDDAAQTVDLTSRISLRLADGVDVNKFVAGTKLVVAHGFAPQWFILQAPDAWTAAREAERLAALPDVLAAHPVRRFPMRTAGPYAARFNDRLIPNQWNLENRDITGAQPGVDLNVRAAWPFSQGKGVVVAIADEGVELAHPDFVNPAAGQPHYNFENQTTNGNPLLASDNHGTAVAGYAVAQGNNGIGISGVAPAASLASWKMLNATEEAIGNMFQYMSNAVSVQNHSWLLNGSGLAAASAMEATGLSNALTLGRGGHGIIMTRASGNYRFPSPPYHPGGANANDQSYTSDPRVITVAGARITGRAANYSTPGASVLVAAPVGDGNSDAPPTTDRVGATLGYNQVNPFNGDDSADYAFNSLSPHGTSFAAPQIAGLGALMLGANTNLAIRDVQQILALSARHYDLADRDLATNGAGLRVSHNLGFGVPDAGLAVRLAQVWSNRPPASTITLVSNDVRTIPDAGFLVRTTGADVPAGLNLIAGLMPQEGLHPDEPPGENLRPDAPTASLPLVFVGLAASTLTTNLTGKAALIQRDGTNLFHEKIKRAQDAGAAFAIVFDNVASSNLVSMQLTNGVLAIPSIFINQTNGDALAAVAQTNANLRVQIELDAARYPFAVTNELACEHVGVRVQTTHGFRGDLRITVTSPSGTRSILQRFNPFSGGGSLTDWTYFSTHHFFERTAGTWTVQVSDEEPVGTGDVTSVSLILKGVSILDTDGDGLDDNWETARLGSLASGPLDDPDGDGFNNAREQAVGSHPNDPNSPFPFALDASVWNPSLRLLRVSWPAAAGRAYELRVNTNSAGAFTTLTNVTGRFPDGEVFLPYGGGPQFFQLRAP